MLPEFFKSYLKGLSDEQAEELWEYLDSDSQEAIQVLVDSHPKVAERDKQKG